MRLILFGVLVVAAFLVMSELGQLFSERTLSPLEGFLYFVFGGMSYWLWRFLENSARSGRRRRRK